VHASARTWATLDGHDLPRTDHDRPDRGVRLCARCCSYRQQLTTTTCNPVNTTNVAVSTCTRRPARRELLDDHDLSGTHDRQRSNPSADLHAGGRQRGQPLHTTVCTVQTTSIPSGTCVPDPPTLANGWTTTAATS
jgi:hypothetical protein